MKNKDHSSNENRNRDGHAGAFLGGGTAGAIVGAAVGSVAGPVGTAAGAAIGGFGGAKAGEGIASMPDEDEKFWRQNYSSRDYSSDDITYDDLAPGYRAGYSGAREWGADGRSFEQVEDKIRSKHYDESSSPLPWIDVRDAARDSYDRTIHLRKEELRAKKESVQSGEVKVRKEVVSENQTLKVPVEREEVIVERSPSRGASMTSGEISGRSEEVARIPVREERVTLEKQTVPVEDVKVSKRKVQDEKSMSGTVRREEAKVESSGQVKLKDKK